MTQLDDIALLLLGMGKENAAKVMSHFSETQTAAVTAAMQHLQHVDVETVNRVLSTLFRDMERQTPSSTSTVTIPSEEKKSPVSEMDALNAQPDFVVAQLIVNEHPQVIAVVLSQLHPEKAAKILSRFTRSTQVAVIKRISNIGVVSRFALTEIERMLTEKLKDAVILNTFNQGGVEASTQIINFLDSDLKSDLMAVIKSQDDMLSPKMGHELFSFEQLMSLKLTDLSIVVNKTAETTLLHALKGCDDLMRKQLFAGMSSEKSQAIRTDLNALGPVQLNKIQDAQNQMVLLAQQLIKSGLIQPPSSRNPAVSGSV